MTEPMGERGRQGAAPLGGHTPGPWHVGVREAIGDEYGTTAIIISAKTPGDVALVGRDEDARLIAAAPELLEALEGCFYNRLGWQDQARAALAKARGEQ